MIKIKTPRLLLAGLVLGAMPAAHAVSLITPGDTIYGIDLDIDNNSNPAGSEGAAKAFDGDRLTKYLNLGAYNSGVILSGLSGNQIQSMVLTTANDHEERDPTSYLIFGTNSTTYNPATTSTISDGWTLISGANLSLPSGRNTSTVTTAPTTYDVLNANGYSSYWLVFPNLKNNIANPNSMSIAEIGLYSGTGGTGTAITASSVTATSWGGYYPNNSDFAEQPNKVIDGNTSTKYLNFGGAKSGFVVYPSVGMTIPTGFVLSSANDAVTRTPTSYSLYGQDGGGNWVLISTNTLTDAQAPKVINTTGEEVPITSPGGQAFRAYAFIANTNGGDGSMQLAEFTLNGTVVPEVSSALLGVMGVAGLVLRRRR